MEKDNYYESLKNESYKAMLDSEIQAGIARDQAMKYTQNQMNASGYGTQGLAQSSMLGVQNNYRNALASAASQYRSDINAINANERAEQLSYDNDNFKSVSSLMSAATNIDQLNEVYNAYKDDNSLSDNSKQQLKLLYSMYSSDLSNETSNAEFDLTSENATAVRDGKVVTVNVGEHFNRERNTLVNAIRTNKLENNSIIKLRNNSRDEIYVMYQNGKLYYVDEEAYNEAKANKQYTYDIIGENNIHAN